jgi:hypothetical protein
MLSSRIFRIVFISFLFTIIICLLADFLFTKYFTVTCETCASNKLQRLINETHSNEIPIFGSSRAEKGYLPDSLGNNFYNYGLRSQSFDVTAFLLQFELKKNKTTPIIIDVHHDFFQHDPYENINAEVFVPFALRSDVKKFLTENNRMHAYYTIPGIRYFGMYANYLKPLVEQNFHIGNVEYAKGGVFDTKTTNTISFKKRIDNRLTNELLFKPNGGKHKLLIEMISNNPSRHFVFIISPYHWSARSSVQNFYEMLKYFHQIDEEFENATFIYFDTSDYGDEYFKDTVHLNIYGAAKYSTQLKQELLNQGIINQPNGI